MSLFLDNNYISTKYDTKYPMNCLVHTYNKKYFNNQEETLEMLMNKVLLPGEVAFGYYYDEKAQYGTNAIFAVGPLSHGSGNIIFKNSAEIDKLIKDLSTYITTEKEEIDINLQNAQNNINNLITEATDYLHNVETNVNNIINNANDIITTLNIYNTSIHDILIFNNGIEEQINDLNDKIENTSTYIINIISDAFSGNNPDSSLSQVINEFKQDITNNIQGLDDISSNLNILTNNFNNFKNNEFETYKKIIQILSNKIKVLEHMILHVLEIPEEDAEKSLLEIIQIISEGLINKQLTFIDLNNISIG